MEMPLSLMWEGKSIRSGSFFVNSKLPLGDIVCVVFMIIIITFVIYLVSEVLIDRLSSDQIWR